MVFTSVVPQPHACGRSANRLLPRSVPLIGATNLIDRRRMDAPIRPLQPHYQQTHALVLEPWVATFVPLGPLEIALPIATLNFALRAFRLEERSLLRIARIFKCPFPKMQTAESTPGDKR